MLNISDYVEGPFLDFKALSLDVFYAPFSSTADLLWTLAGLYAQLPLWLEILLPLLLVRYIVNHVLAGYQACLDLGQGGTPANWWGGWRIQRLLFCGRLANVFEAPHVPPGLKPYRGQLFGLPERQGERPTVIGCAPQRQINQKTSVETFDQHIENLEKIAATYPELLKTEISFLESHTTALKAKQTAKTDETPTTAEFGHEIGHPHRIDGSMHMILHPEDVKTVIEAKWGERHPIANTSWYWLKWFHRTKFDENGKPRRPPVPEYLCFIYAPRNEADMATIKRIIAAAAWFVTGEDKIEFPADENYEA